MEQKIITLTSDDGQYYNFFNTSGGLGSLARHLDDGWVVKEMDIKKEYESGWVLLERKQDYK